MTRAAKDPVASQLVLDDGTPVEPGMRVWQVHCGYASITRAKVERHWLTMWSRMLDGRLFATEQAAIAFAIKEARARLAKARKDCKLNERAITQLRARVANKGVQR